MNRQAVQTLKTYFGYDTFREGQESVVESILEHRDVLAIMPTGAGKSICYQVPALMLSGITIVISPLISLMQDQVKALNEAGIHAAFINSSLSESQISKALYLAAGGRYKIIYVAPERLENYEFLEFARQVEISMVTVDEAHCISQWGQDFRPSYVKIVDFVKNLPGRPIVSAFTATATEEVKNDILCTLKLEDPKVVITGFDRKNLYYSVENIRRKDDFVMDYIDRHPTESGIIYCSTRKNVDNLFELLFQKGVAVTRYHAGLNNETRKKNQDDFIYDRTPVIIATNAFGMGIDKSNIRYIIHFTIPKNIEGYYQEIGRAGRDGLSAKCYLFFNRADIRTLEYLIYTTVQLNRKEIEIKKLQQMIDFCETKECLRAFILRYFGEQNIREYCTNCSNCLSNDELRDYTIEAQKVLSCVYRAKERYGISVLIDVLRGMVGPKIINDKLNQLSTYGIMKDYSSKFIRDFIKVLIEYGYVSLRQGTYSMLQLNEKSYKILKSDLKVVLKLEADNEEKVLNNMLFNKLKLWRRDVAIQEGVKPYIIFSDATLIELCNKLPQNEEELLEIRGMGEKKFKKYGEKLIELLKED